MPINTDKSAIWKSDIRASVDQFNQWFMTFAPKAYRDSRSKTVEDVERGLLMTADLTNITPEVIKQSPGILPALRMSTCPPLARDRLIGLADSTKNFVGALEKGKLPRRFPLNYSVEICNALLPFSRGCSTSTFSLGSRRVAAPRRRSATARRPSLQTGFAGQWRSQSCATPRRSDSLRSLRNT